MAKSNSSSAFHWMLGAALFLITFFVIVALVRSDSQADDVNSSVGITNAAPTVDNIFFNHIASFAQTTQNPALTDGILNLTSGTTSPLKISGTVSDANGDSDISGVQMAFYSAEALNQSCSIDVNNCYKVASCAMQAGDADSLQYNCPIDLGFWANSSRAGGAEAGTDWTAWVEVTDAQAQTGTLTATLDIDTMLSLEMPGPIDWGTLAQGATTTSGTNEDQTVTQKGNDKADINVSGTAMGCSNTGTIPVGNIKYDVNDDGHATGGAVLSGTPTLLNLTVPYQITASAVTDLTHWEIEIPAFDVSGTCSGTVTMTAIASAD